MTKIFTELIDVIFWTKDISKTLLRIYYSFLLNGDDKKFIANIFNKAKFNVVLCYQNQVDYFLHLENRKLRIAINQSIESSHDSFYSTINKLIKFKDFWILESILKQTRLS